MKIIWCIVLLIGVTTDPVRTAPPPITLKNAQDTGDYLQRIRALMINTTWVGEPIQALLIPMYDAHQSEYVSERDKRIQFLTNFTGSAGTVIITHEKAALWTDSRYHEQAEHQIDLRQWDLMKQGLKDVPTTKEWLIDNLPLESIVGVDPFLISSSNFESLSHGLNKSGHSLVAIHTNLVDILWDNRPPISNKPLIALPYKYSGSHVSEKVEKLLLKIKEKDALSAVVTALDEIAWLLNLRGSDILYNPVFFGYLIITEEKLYLYIERSKVTPEIHAHLQSEACNYIIDDYENILEGIAKLLVLTTGNVLLSNDVSQAIYESIPLDRRVSVPSIIARMKAIKNPTESKGIRECHIRDGVALVRYLHWLDVQLSENQNVTELSGAKKLEQFRKVQENYKGLSFESTSSVGSNAAMAHYSPTKETDRQITRDEIYLIDSGGQYWDGTTDVTRTVHFGTPTEFEKQCFTRVLQGFIALATSVFPVNTRFSYFDYIARRPLWMVGLNYGHGTGHGVGAFLNVHEYPPLLSTSNTDTDPGALEHMFTSNEPGYYHEGEFGIRLEDIIEIVKADGLEEAFENRGGLKFQSVTLAPIQTKMIATELLTRQEIDYINCYHAEVLKKVGSLLLLQGHTEAYQWLSVQCKEIKRVSFQ